MDPVSPTYRSHSSAERLMTSRDRRAHEQFAREYAEQVLRTRAALLARTQ
jgi:hypothetical protein